MNGFIIQVIVFGIKSSSLKDLEAVILNHHIILAKNVIIVGEVPKLVDTCKVLRLLIYSFVTIFIS